jgi:hypothetical protein
MNIRFEAWVEPLTVEGNGIPFGRRTMYAVRTSVAGSVTSTAPAYWSKRVARLVAEEKVHWSSRAIAAWFAEMVADFSGGSNAA